jgi:probable HAF family extracellular repeat protein
MFTGWKRTVAVVAAALAVGLLWVGLTTAAKPKPPAPPPVTYTMTLVPPLVYNGVAVETRAYGMNNLGHMVGWAAAEDRLGHAWLYTPETGTVDLHSLISPDGRVCEALDINDFGQIVGRYQPPPGQGPTKGFRYTPPTGTFEVLDPPGNFQRPFVWVRAINNWGDAVGYVDSDEGLYAFVWPAGQTHAILLFANGVSRANDINDSRQITGYWVLDNGEARAFRCTFDDSGAVGVLDLGVLGTSASGRRWSGGRGINDSGQVTGESSAQDAERSRAFRYTDGQGMVNLGILPTKYRPNQYGESRGVDIDNGGRVVGYSSSSSGAHDSSLRPFLWTETHGILDLWTLITVLPEAAKNCTAESVDLENLTIRGSPPSFGPIASNLIFRDPNTGVATTAAFILWPNQ